MSVFKTNTKAFQKQVAQAAEWMMRRNVGHNHWWRWQVFTSSNPDREVGRPIFEQQTAMDIFADLVNRKLLFQIVDAYGNPVPVDKSGLPAYFMRYDSEGWSKVIAEGRPFRGIFLKAKRDWPVILVSLVIGGCAVGLKDIIGDQIKTAVLGKEPEKKPTDK
jgi:hypothetical protein